MKTLERNLLGVPMKQTPRLLPGLTMAGLLAWLSLWLSTCIGVNLMGFQKSPVSPVTMAILLGLIAGNLFSLPQWLRPGLTFVAKKVLRLGIILLGIRLSVFDVVKLGALGVPIVLLCVLGALALTILLSKWLNLPERLATLIAVGTSICGVSAIIATGPAIDARDEEVAYAVAVVTAFGIVATLAYPYMVNAIYPGDAIRAGLFLGTAVHDTSQVTGAAMVHSDVFSLPRALDVATVTKLVRNVFMVAVIPLMASYYAHRTTEKCESKRRRVSIAKLLPLFIVGFLTLAAFRSIGDAGVRAAHKAWATWYAVSWEGICAIIKHWAANLLVVALASVGLSTRFSMLRGLGIKPFIVGLGAAVAVGGMSLVAISLLGRFVEF